MDPNTTNCNPALPNLARDLVGDGKTPNIYFVTHQITGRVWAVYVGDGTTENDMAEEAIAFADRYPEPLMVEDRLTGVVHDNPAGERYQEACEEQENETSQIAIKNEIVRHMARAFFACAWADYAEQVGPHYAAGSDIMEVMPEELDPSAVWVAFDLARELEAHHGKPLDQIFARAVEISESYQGRSRGGDRPRTAEMFGHYAAMQAMGQGVGLWDALGSYADEYVFQKPCYFDDYSWQAFDETIYPDTRPRDEQGQLIE